ncbi:MAG: guanylate kinase [Phycisphaerae bacterium]
MTSENTTQRGNIIVISGPSGVGKSTVCRHLCERLPAEFSVSITTRKPRPGEENERDYRFISQEAFDDLKRRGALLEWAQVYGHSYGTPLDAVREAIEHGRTIILEIDINGCVQVRKKMPEAKAFFLLPPTPEEQKRRIVGRNTDPTDVIRERLSKADGEIRYAMEAGCFDEFLVNDHLDETVDRICQLVRCDRRENKPETSN